MVAHGDRKNIMETNGTTKFSSLFTPAEIICHSESSDRNNIIREILNNLAEKHKDAFNVDEAFQNIIQREEQHCTIISQGLALPHARLDIGKHFIVGIATSREGLKYCDHEDHSYVKLIVLILVPLDAPNAYLQVASSLAKICQHPNSPNIVANFNSKEEIWQYFDRGGEMLPAYICARDIMEECPTLLYETDTMEKAIDLFVEHKKEVLPVIDRDNDFVGIVSADVLFKVCLPEYILWMDDLTPIIQFEPFRQLLRDEKKTSLEEILNKDCAFVQEDVPAIQVAKEMIRRNVREVFVIREKKLVGVITLHGFINKVLRV